MTVRRKKDSRRTTWLLVGAGAAMVAGQLVERGLDSGWRAWKGEDPPTFEQGDSWSRALAWTAVGAAELFARRSAHLGLRQMTGKRAPAGL